MNLGVGQMEVTGSALHLESVLADRLEVTAQQEMDIMAIEREATAVVAANGSGADDGDAGRGGIKRRGGHLSLRW
jgi:hypothetical protein